MATDVAYNNAIQLASYRVVFRLLVGRYRIRDLKNIAAQLVHHLQSFMLDSSPSLADGDKTAFWLELFSLAQQDSFGSERRGSDRTAQPPLQRRTLSSMRDALESTMMTSGNSGPQHP